MYIPKIDILGLFFFEENGRGTSTVGSMGWCRVCDIFSHNVQRGKYKFSNKRNQGFLEKCLFQEVEHLFVTESVTREKKRMEACVSTYKSSQWPVLEQSEQNKEQYKVKNIEYNPQKEIDIPGSIRINKQLNKGERNNMSSFENNSNY